MTDHYQLLGVDAGDLTGPLAKVVAEEVEKYAAVFKAVGSYSKLARKNVELLGIDCYVDEEAVFHASPSGLLAKETLAKQLVESAERAINVKGWPIVRRDGKLIFTMYQPAIPSAPAMKVLAARVHHQRTGHPRASTSTLQITGKCQADCKHCSAARHMYKGRPDLPTEVWKNILRQIEDLGVVNIVFTGGEPLLRPDIFELVSWVRKDESNAMMFTNGLLLDDEHVKRLVDAGLFSVNVSIDSADPAAHDAMRKVPNCFDKAIAGLQRAKDAGLVVGISTYATPEGLHNGDVNRMIQLAVDVGAHELTIFDVVPTGRLLQEHAANLLSDADKDELMKIEEEWNVQRNLPHIITQAHVNGPKGAGCYAGWFQFYMTAYGDMMPCDFTPLTVGNATEEPVEALWNRLIAHPVYATNCNHCRMQDASFRAKYIDHIPEAGPFPYPICDLTTPEGREQAPASTK